VSPPRIEPLNGIELYYDIQGEGEPLLWLHGFGGAGSNWGLIFKEVPAGFRLILPDLRGHGRSTNPSGEFTFRQAALDVLALLDRLGLDRVKAIGLSGGAETLLHMATGQPERIDAMALVSATPRFPEEARRIMRQMTVESHSEDEWKMMRQWHHHGDEQIRALWAIAHNFKDSYEDVNFTREDLSRITARTLIVHGDRDPLYPPRLALEMYEAIPRAYLWIVPNGNHGPIYGAMAPRFLETASAFLRGEWGA